LLLPVFFGCDQEPADEYQPQYFLPGDNYVPVANSFNGVWKDADDTYWKFNTDGTGGKAETATGPFENEFSFLVFTGYYDQGGSMNPNPSIVTLDDDGTVTRYEFTIESDVATLTPKPSGEDITLEWVSGKAAALNLTNDLIGGEIAAVWNITHATTPFNGSWSIKYNANGTVRLYHHQASHQFTNSYLLRGDKLVIFGSMRFYQNPVVATLTLKTTSSSATALKDTWQVTETAGGTNGAITWVYTKVAGAKWKDGVVEVSPVADPYVPVENPFIGVWKEAEDSYWEFRTDGTGGYATTATGEFSDEFSLVVTASSGNTTSLVMLNDTEDSITATRYTYVIENGTATLTQVLGGSATITLERESGEPQILTLTNDLIGELAAVWNATTTLNGSWSIKFRTDGSVRHYHHQMNHQFNNGYVLRGNTLAIFGTGGRFTSNPVTGTLTSTTANKDTWKLQESSTPWIYTKINAAVWI
jgi:hypothetical protein